MTKRLMKITVIAVLSAIFSSIILLGIWANNISNLLQKSERDMYEGFSVNLMKHPIIETRIEFTDPEILYLGRYRLTYYCSCTKCCGKSDGITASGAIVQENHTVAVDPSIIPLGSKLLINGVIYTAEDTGSAIREQRIDIYVPTHEEALRKGVDYADIYLLTE